MVTSDIDVEIVFNERGTASCLSYYSWHLSK